MLDFDVILMRFVHIDASVYPQDQLCCVSNALSYRGKKVAYQQPFTVATWSQPQFVPG